MKKVAFIFPGQGSQFVGMSKSIYDEYSSAREVFQEADDALGFSITDMILNGPEEDLRMTENTQPAILTVSTAICSVMHAMDYRPSIVAGHSLGEYSALVESGVLKFEIAATLVKKRGQYMQTAVPAGEGKMAAVLGAEADVVEKSCFEVDKSFGVVETANYNCPGQIVIAGAAAAVDEAIRIMKDNGVKKVIPLQVSAPFHTSLMKPAAEKLAVDFANVYFDNSSIPFVSNYNGSFMEKGEEIKDSLLAQISNRILWENCVAKMLEFGVDIFVEIGPGKTLTSFVKKINKEVKCYNIGELKDLDAFLNEAKE